MIMLIKPGMYQHMPGFLKLLLSGKSVCVFVCVCLCLCICVYVSVSVFIYMCMWVCQLEAINN